MVGRNQAGTTDAQRSDDVTASSSGSQEVVIFGAGKGARAASRYLADDTDYRVVGYVVDREFFGAPSLDGKPVVATEDMLTAFPPADVRAFVALGAGGMNAIRAAKASLMRTAGYHLISYVHSSMRSSGMVKCGDNCFILDGQTVNYDVLIGANVTIWSGCHLGDRSRIEDDAFLGSHVVLNADVTVGQRSYLASNSTISNGVRIGRACFIGANALISGDTDDEAVHVCKPTVALGVPSHKFLKLMMKDIL